MTAKARSTLKSEFETGDKPDGSDYADLIDSFLSLSDTTAQSVTSNLTVPTITVGTQLVLSGQIVWAHTTALASAGAAEAYLKVTVSGVDYGIPIYRDGS